MYWYRKVVPQHLRAALGCREIKRSLGTKNLREAKQRYPTVAAEAEHRLAVAAGRLERPVRLRLQQVVALSGKWYRQTLAQQEPNSLPAEEYDILLSLAADVGESGRIAEFTKPYLDPLLASEGLVHDADSRAELSSRLFWDAVQFWNTLTRRAHGDYLPDPRLTTLPPREARKLQPAAGQGVSLTS